MKIYHSLNVHKTCFLYLVDGKQMFKEKVKFINNDKEIVSTQLFFKSYNNILRLLFVTYHRVLLYGNYN